VISVEDCQTKIKSLEKESDKLSKSIERIKIEIQGINVDETSDIESAKLKMDELSKQETVLRNDLDAMKDSLRAKEYSKKTQEEITSEIEKLNSKREAAAHRMWHLEYIESIFDNKGIRHDMLTAFLPLFEKYVNDYTERILPDLCVVGSTVTEGKTVTKMELNFKIRNKLTGLEKNFSSWSGGHKKILSLIMRFALTKTSSLFKKSLNVLFLDEIFGCLGVENRQRVIEFLKEYQQENNTPVVVISHLEDTKDFFDVVYNVESVPGKGAVVTKMRSI
jgi:DNA repair exonuclease SbcCD ATPase subunit